MTEHKFNLSLTYEELSNLIDLCQPSSEDDEQGARLYEKLVEALEQTVDQTAHKPVKGPLPPAVVIRKKVLGKYRRDCDKCGAKCRYIIPFDNMIICSYCYESFRKRVQLDRRQAAQSRIPD